MREARSRVLDAEYAEETVKVAKYQIPSNASSAMLVQSNASKALILELLK
jgi:flagellin-like hook-associated protein FlgL